MNRVAKPTGFVSIIGAKNAQGQSLDLESLVRRGSIIPCDLPTGIQLERGAIPLGHNLFLDSGRQLMAYLFGGRSPMTDYACRNFGVGTGTTPVTVVDTSLESPVNFSGGQFKAIDAVEFPSPFQARVQMTIASGDANGSLLTEFGLFSGSQVLLARMISTGLNKSSDFAPSLSWVISF